MIHATNPKSAGASISWFAHRGRRRSLIAILVWLACISVLWKLTINVYVFAASIVLTYLSIWALCLYLSGLPSLEMAKRFLLANFSLLFMLACFEIPALLRKVDYRLIFRTPILAKEYDPRYLRDRELIFIRRPHDRASGISRGGDISFLFDTSPVELYPFDVRYDQHGFRNGSDLTSADIAVIGDSIVEGNFVSYGEIATSVLARLRKRTVANLGQIGYGPNEELVILRRYALPLHPKTVFWFFFEGNDLDNVLYYRRVMANWDAYAAKFDTFVDRSFTKNAFLAVNRLAGDPRPSGRPRSGLVRTSSGELKRMYFFYPTNRLEGAKLSALEETYNILAQAQVICKANQMDFIAVFVPSKGRVYRGIAQFESDSIVPQWLPNDLPERMREALARISPETGYIDLTPALIGAAQKGEVQYLLQDSHFSAAGHRTIALALDDFLSGREAEKTAPAARTHRRSPASCGCLFIRKCSGVE